MATHAMIDIETLGTEPGSVVLSVGAVKFDPFNSIEPNNGKHWMLDVDAQTEKGRIVDESTLAWWGKQEQSIQDRAFSDVGRTDVDVFMKDLNGWLTGCEAIWCQGPQFDMVILEDLFKNFDHHMNWFYWQVMDCRTLFKMMPADPRKAIQENLHDAQADAHWQAVCVQQFYRDFNVLPR
jgi:hypothetical protein